MAKQSNFANMTIALTAICLICSAVLGVVYTATKAPIEAAEIAKINSAIAGVVPTFDNVPSNEKFSVSFANKDYKVYPAKNGNEIVGYAIETYTTKGFSGKIVLMVGFTPDGNIFNTSVVSHAETPGLGDKMEASKSDFSLQFIGKNPEKFDVRVKQDGGDVDAITASTITSRAFGDAVQTAYSIFSNIEK